MKCIVTGGAGFIGSQIVDLLIDMGMNVSVVDDLSTGSESNLNPLAELHKINILDSSALESVCQDVDLFFHTAAWARIQPSFDQPFEHEQTNVIGTIRCLQAVMGKRLTKFVLSSSSAIYGDTTTLPIQESCPPNILSPYALQKYAAEQYCLVLGRRFNIPVIALRYFNVYGPRSINPNTAGSAYSSVAGVFARQHRTGQPLTITGDGEQSRDFVHARDVAHANLEAAFSDRSLEVYNVGSGVGVTVNQLAHIVGGEIEYLEERQGEARHSLADISKIKKEIGWKPTVTLQQGMDELLKQSSED